MPGSHDVDKCAAISLVKMGATSQSQLGLCFSTLQVDLIDMHAASP